YSKPAITSLGLVPPTDPRVSDMRYVQGSATSGVRRSAGTGETAGADASASAQAAGEGQPAMSIQGLPRGKPPYGRITAIDLDRGEIRWQVPHGATPDPIRNHPALKGITIPRTGQAGHIGTLVTKTLVVAGESEFTTTASGRGAMLRAYDKQSGKEVGA